MLCARHCSCSGLELQAQAAALANPLGRLRGAEPPPPPPAMTPPDFLLRVPPLKLHVRDATQAEGEPPLYELFCRLTSPAAGGAVEWSLWKTYEEFQAFDHRMRESASSSFAKMMVTVSFAPVHRVRAFFGQDQRPSFLEKRRAELDFFVQRIMLFPNVVEFDKPGARGSKVLAEFISASQFMDCAELFKGGEGGSPTTTISSATGLRDSNNSNSLSSSRGLNFNSSRGPRASDDSSHSIDRQTTGGSSRRAYKLEIEEELTLRFGEHQLKRFKKRSRAFRKENDRVAGAKVFVAYLEKEFEPEFSDWLLRTYIHSLKSEEERRVLRMTGGIPLPLNSQSLDEHDEDERRSSRKCGTLLTRKICSDPLTLTPLGGVIIDRAENGAIEQ